MRKILVTGATGHTGRHAVPLLLERYGEITCFVRPTSNRSAISLPGVSFVEGNLDDEDSVTAALRGHDTIISVAYLYPASRAEGIVRACRANNIRRGVFISTTSIFTTLNTKTKTAKIGAEQAVRDSGLDYTLLRPTMIYGTPEDRNMIQLIRYLRRFPVVLVPGNGQHLQQPIHVDDLAQAIVTCIETEITIGKAYNVSGAQPVTFNQVVEQASQALGVKRLKIHLPLGPVFWVARLLQRLPGKRLVTEEQVRRLNEDKSFDHNEARRDFGFSPRPFAEGIRQEVALWQGIQEGASPLPAR
jgi:nucleoside-diphosphate-sugar epimerase